MLALLLLLCPIVQSRLVYSIPNATLISYSFANTTTLRNLTCEECLCSAWQKNSTVFNCFSNNKTCQFFDPVPRLYRVRSHQQARLYFPRGVLPNKSECCMPDLNELINKLNSAMSTKKTFHMTKPRCLVIDNHGYLVTVSADSSQLYRIDRHRMTLILNHNIPGSSLMNIAYYQEAYYVTTNVQSILIINSNNLNMINTIRDQQINGPRDMIFLDNGRRMILASADSQDLLFFNLENNRTRNYTYVRAISTSYPTPHGLWYVNDSFFYVTSWGDKKIFSYSTTDSVSWTQKYFADAGSAFGGNGDGSHVTVDDSQRVWFSSNDAGMVILDRNGTRLSNFSAALNGVFDTLFADNYVMYLSDYSGNQIIRLDPGITC